MTFHVRSDEDGTVRVSMAAHLDGEVARGLERVLSELGEAGRATVFDASGLDSVDSEGLRVLVAAGAAARNAGSRFTIANAPPRLVRLLELTDLTELLHLEPRERPAT